MLHIHIDVLLFKSIFVFSSCQVQMIIHYILVVFADLCTGHRFHLVWHLDLQWSGGSLDVVTYTLGEWYNIFLISRLKIVPSKCKILFVCLIKTTVPS